MSEQSDLNREIAELLGYSEVTVSEQHGWPSKTAGRPPGLGEHVNKRFPTWEPIPDYEHDLNASMAVIRERWDDAEVYLSRSQAVLWTDRTMESLCHTSDEGDTDAKRLAHALKEALSE